MINRDRHVSLESRRGPLVRFLEANVDRPWNMVYSDLCRQLKRNSYNDCEIRRYIERVVHLDARFCDGQLVDGGTRSHGGVNRPLRPGMLYVCPRTALLRVVRRRAAPRAKPKAAEPPIVKIDNAYQCHWRDGVWYLLTMVALTPEGTGKSSKREDVWLQMPLSAASNDTLRKTYGGLLYAVRCRALNKHELRNWPIPLEWQ